MSSTLLLAPMAIGAGALAGICFLAILVFGLLAVRSLTGHIRKSHRPWEGEVNGGIPMDEDDQQVEGPATSGRPTDGTTVGR